jgi:hypothetical protein
VSDPTLIADLIRAGVDAELVQRVVNEVSASRDASRYLRDARVRSAERSRAYRDRKRDASRDASRDAHAAPPSYTGSKPTNTQGNQPPAPPIVPPSPEPKPKPKKQQGRVHRLPPDWQPSDADRFYGQTLGLSEFEIDKFAEDMRLWAAGKGATGVDWSARFKGWMRRNLERSTGPPTHVNGKLTVQEAARQNWLNFAEPNDDRKPKDRKMLT